MTKSTPRVARDVEALGKVLAALADVDKVQRGWVIASAISKLGIAAATIHCTPITGAVNHKDSRAVVPGKPGSKEQAKEHAKHFLRWKNAPTDVLRAAVLGYYLTHFKNKASYTPIDLRAMNDEAAGIAVNNMNRAMENATKKNKYFVSVGRKGEVRITMHGEAIVEALPDMVAVAAVKKAGLSPKRKTVKRKKNKAA
jgi:hypothetical protein